MIFVLFQLKLTKITNVTTVTVNNSINICYNINKLRSFDWWWAGPDGTAMPGQPVTEVEQAPSTPSFSKNQFNKLVPR